MITYPHDLIWIRSIQAISGFRELPVWVSDTFKPNIPLVVRRDIMKNDLIPVGIRGKDRAQRCGVFVCSKDIIKIVSPHMLLNNLLLTEFSHFIIKTLKEFQVIFSQKWQEKWGPTGSVGFSLATGKKVFGEKSDIDILAQCPSFIAPKQAQNIVLLCDEWRPVRFDIVLETPFGGVSLKDWAKSDMTKKVLLKTGRGPCLVLNPWERPE